MKSRITAKIDGMNYTIISEETPEYINKVAALVDGQITDMKQNSSMSVLEYTVLSTMNIADMYYKSQQSYENMRTQIREYAEENSALRAELNKLKRN